MMFELKDVMEAVGPNASLVFAAWIFLSYLQTRYGDTYERFRALGDEYRCNQASSEQRRATVGREVLLYKRRCQQMRVATNIGVISALLLIASLVVNGCAVVWPATAWNYIGSVFAIGGLLLVMTAASIVLLENAGVQSSLENELDDLPDLKRRTSRKIWPLGRMSRPGRPASFMWLPDARANPWLPPAPVPWRH